MPRDSLEDGAHRLVAVHQHNHRRLTPTCVAGPALKLPAGIGVNAYLRLVATPEQTLALF